MGTCRLFGIDRQVYYRAVKSENKSRTISTQVVRMIQAVRMRLPACGTRKLYSILQRELKELGVGRDRLFSIVRANHLGIQPKKQYHVTTNSYHRFRKHKNLTEVLVLRSPEQLWVADITYIGNRKNPMYLSLVTDAYSKQIMGFDVSISLHAKGAINALKRAIKNRKYPKKELIHHSDRGFQYCCDEYQSILKNSDINCSMTEKYDPYQNAVAERVNGILKQEFIRGITIRDLTLMTKLIQESIYIYNNERPHWSCYMNTPNQMHKQNKIKIRTYKTKNNLKTNLEVIN